MKMLRVFPIVLIFCGGLLHAAPLENITLADDARLRVIAAAEKYEHTPYRYGGLDRRGLDCSGLVYLSFHDALGVSIPRNTQGLYSWVEMVTAENALPGDLVFFKTTGNGTISHVGIFLGDRRFIHAASDGPSTGVIYSNLDERYWSRTYAGMGRALPEADIRNGTGKKAAAKKENSNVSMGVAVAPSWNTFFDGSGAIRGIAGQFGLGAAVKPFGQPMIFGIELRPEWDGALGVFRVPLTLSWGLSDKLRFFAGPALSFGDASLTVSGNSRRYTGGTSWFGAAGMTVAPFRIKIAGNDLAPYGELAWQSYLNANSDDAHWGLDIAAGMRVSTGLRYIWK